MPATRTGGSNFKSSMKSRTGFCSRSNRAMSEARPLCQVCISQNIVSPDTSGTQPPSSSLVRLASRKAMSTMNSSDNPVRSRRLSLPVRDLMRLKVKGVTMVMAPETAKPYAPPSAAELPKPMTNASAATMRIQFMVGT